MKPLPYSFSVTFGIKVSVPQYSNASLHWGTPDAQLNN
jgi:hypothetical protein